MQLVWVRNIFQQRINEREKFDDQMQTSPKEEVSNLVSVISRIRKGFLVNKKEGKREMHKGLFL